MEDNKRSPDKMITNIVRNYSVFGYQFFLHRNKYRNEKDFGVPEWRIDDFCYTVDINSPSKEIKMKQIILAFGIAIASTWLDAYADQTRHPSHEDEAEHVQKDRADRPPERKAAGGMDDAGSARRSDGGAGGAGIRGMIAMIHMR